MYADECILSLFSLLLDRLYEKAYNSAMEQTYQLIRIWKRTHQTLRKIAAETDESLVEALERMANEEWRRLQQQEGGQADAALQKNQDRSL